uniref:Uncharacterized protein LOC104210257 n=1 Tax=Nicotiana sylvestris TaxID=4096 RepID=A0A1U7UML3_NICSY|nr:PREDICTED: uncharacterized protein LOC104210257 [Nicotiana sylvestris]
MLFGYWGEGVDRIGFYGDWAGQAFEDSWAAWLFENSICSSPLLLEDDIVPFLPNMKLKNALSTWSRATFGDIFQKIASLEEVVRVHEAQFEINPTVQNREILQKVQAELVKNLALEEKFWKQKAGMQWFNDGDRNTKLFHAHVNGRRKRLQLKRIQNTTGVWIEDNEEMANEAVQNFQKQFHEEVVPTTFDIIEHVPHMVDMEHNQELLRQPTTEEDIVEEDVVEMVKAFFNGQDLPRFITHTNLVLLPKKKEGRSIIENVLLTQEIITDIRLRTKAGPNVVIKLDMMKAYDKLSWLFLTKILRKMGFSERFIGWVYGLVSNNWYSVLINGQPHGFFKSTRGIKQGDPLSPTLFILTAEALSRGLNVLHNNLYFCGFGLPKWSPKINHLAYADDTVIFSSLDETSLQLITQVLSAYEAASGLLINKAKSAVYMHHLTNETLFSKVERVSGIRRQEFPFTYLGCPIFYSMRKMEYYNGLINKVVLISHVIQSISIHLLSAVNAPAFVINKLHKLMARFFWSSSIEGGSRTKPSLWSSFMSQKYCKKLNAIVVPWRRNGSHIWRKMLECRDSIEHQILWQPKMGSALFWFENWTGLGDLYFITPPDFFCDESVQNVNEVLNGRNWNEHKLRELLPEDLANHILQNIKPPGENMVLDKPFWMLETRGEFTMRSAWDYIRIKRERCKAYKMIWVKGLPFKVSFFM